MAINLYIKFTSFEIIDASLQKSGLDRRISSHKRPLVSEGHLGCRFEKGTGLEK